jgi:glucoamylase
MREAILTYLYSEKEEMFVKMVNIKNGEMVYDMTLDMSSVYAIFNYGILPATDHRVTVSIATIEKNLRLHTGIDGVPRYVNDAYYRQVEGISNPWYITTLWLARYYVLTATKVEDLDVVNYWLNWVVTHSPKSSVLSEQLHPFTGEQLSATPLTWSHAEYVRLVIAYHAKLEELGLCKSQQKKY